MANKGIENILKNSVFKMVATLVIVGLFSGAALVLIYIHTQEPIIKNINNDSVKAIKNIFPEANHDVIYKKLGELETGAIGVTSEDGKLLGYVFKAEGNGYQGLIKLIVGMDSELTNLVGIEVLESQETPGLGAEIADTSFRKQFMGLSVTHPIEYVKNKKPTEDYQIEAITGATISSRAVVNMLNKRIDEVRKLIGTK